MNIQDKERREFVDWLGRKAFRLLRFTAAGALILILFWSLVPGFMEHANKNIADLIPITKVHIETVTVPQQTGTNVISIEQATNLTAMNIEQMRITTKQEVESSTPRVWAYGLQLAALTAVLGGAFWAIVALCRSDV
jgi:hypothetical protein